jgi:hypothetical protein
VDFYLNEAPDGYAMGLLRDIYKIDPSLQRLAGHPGIATRADYS